MKTFWRKAKKDEAALQEKKSFPFDPFDLSNAHDEPCQLQKLKSFHDVMIDSLEISQHPVPAGTYYNQIKALKPPELVSAKKKIQFIL